MKYVINENYTCPEQDKDWFSNFVDTYTVDGFEVDFDIKEIKKHYTDHIIIKFSIPDKNDYSKFIINECIQNSGVAGIKCCTFLYNNSLNIRYLIVDKYFKDRIYYSNGVPKYKYELIPMIYYQNVVGFGFKCCLVEIFDDDIQRLYGLFCETLHYNYCGLKAYKDRKIVINTNSKNKAELFFSGEAKKIPMIRFIYRTTDQ